MPEETNPYRSPPMPESKPLSRSSIWHRQSRGLKKRWRWGESGFGNGHAVVCSVIAYFIDPWDDQTLFAGSPSGDHSDARLALIAREAIRNLPSFIELHGDSRPRFMQRRLVVRIVETYDGTYAFYDRAGEVLPAPLSRAMPREVWRYDVVQEA